MFFLESFEFIDYLAPEINFKTPTVTWEVKDLVLNKKINLLVGKNATGKTKTLREIIKLAILIQNGNIIGDNYCIKSGFKNNEPQKNQYSNYLYELEVINKRVTKEKLTTQSKKGEKINLIDRDTGKCLILSQKAKEPELIKPPHSTLAIANRDLIKYQYLEDLYKWANSVNAYSFGSLKEIVLDSSMPFKLPQITFEIAGVPISKMYREIFGNTKLEENLIRDLKELNYDIERIQFISPEMTLILEKGIHVPLFIFNISAGMNRAFHTMVVMEYFLEKQEPLTLMIDDVGEGLDFERSSKLIKLLSEKVEKSNIQLIISSNDRFLMNVIDLNYWNILYRNKTSVKAYNYYNSKEKFDQFMDIGLSNFNYFSDFYEEMENAD